VVLAHLRYNIITEANYQRNVHSCLCLTGSLVPTHRTT